MISVWVWLSEVLLCIPHIGSWVQQNKIILFHFKCWFYLDYNSFSDFTSLKLQLEPGYHWHKNTKLERIRSFYLKMNVLILDSQNIFVAEWNYWHVSNSNLGCLEVTGWVICWPKGECWVQLTMTKIHLAETNGRP